MLSWASRAPIFLSAPPGLRRRRRGRGRWDERPPPSYHEQGDRNLSPRSVVGDHQPDPLRSRSLTLPPRLHPSRSMDPAELDVGTPTPCSPSRARQEHAPRRACDMPAPQSAEPAPSSLRRSAPHSLVTRGAAHPGHPVAAKSLLAAAASTRSPGPQPAPDSASPISPHRTPECGVLL